ncbi:hypothetical protein GY45DRAFT_1262514 [Cubamyces sp. BRFM 1775]|nr:hypothetical protein GY45DRAFT_1262514 [Cubamyces sp. BRFM 1775]
MHNLFLGELRHHCREVWGLDVKDKGGDGSKLAPHTPEQQQACLQRVYVALLKQSKTSLRKVRKGYITAVAEANGIVPTSGLFTKDAYIDALLQWIKAYCGPLNLPPVLQESVSEFHLADGPHDLSKFRILDKSTIEQIRRDIAAVVLPSWMERPPRNFGSPSHGKLKADQWRTVCTVNLVITLCRLWGSPESSERERLLLDNFIHLVCAVDLATRRFTDPRRIERCDDHMRQYLASLRSLFAHNLVPNHHLSLHLRDCLLLFGPVHAWWAFPFERYNGLLQQLNVNNKTRDMPLTFMSYFYIGANVRWMMTSWEWPDTAEYRNMVAAFKDAFMQLSQGTRTADLSPFDDAGGCSANESIPPYDERKEVPLPREIYRDLLALITSQGASFVPVNGPHTDTRPVLHDSVNHVTSIRRDYVKYATKASAKRDSFVLFTDPLHPLSSQDAFPRAGQITQIFLHGRIENGRHVVEPFVLLDEFEPLAGEDVTRDPFRTFSDLETRLFYNRSTGAPRLIRARDIQCHFAALAVKPAGIDVECIVARSLNWVSLRIIVGFVITESVVV